MKLLDWLKKAQREKFAICQFNFSSSHQLRGIILGALESKAPLILGVSPGEANFLGLDYVVWEVRFWKEKILKDLKIDWPLFLNLDHAKELSLIEKALKLGFDMVHFDGSNLPFEENLSQTKEVKKLAQSFKALVEGEIGKIPTVSSQLYSKQFKIEKSFLTDLREAEIFVKETKVDLLAPSLGNFHGVDVDFENPHLDLKLLKEIKEKVKDTFLVLHGSSGTPKEDLKEAVKFGISKVNINTDLRLAFVKKLEEKICKEKEIKPYKYLAPAEANLRREVISKLSLFNSQGKVSF